MIWLVTTYVIVGVAIAIKVRHAIPGARLTNVIIAGVLWCLTLIGWLSAVTNDWYQQWKEGGKHW